MKTLNLIICSAAFLLGSNMAWSQDDTGIANATIRLMGNADAELPEAVTNPITLPPSALENEEAVENAALGLETATENRLRRDRGLTTAIEALDRAAQMSADAQDVREGLGRRPDDLPPELPVEPGPPGD